MKLPLYIILFVTMIFSPLYSNGQANQTIQNTLQKYKLCLQNSDEKLIKEVIDESFRLGVYQEPFASGMFASFLKLSQAPDSVYWDNKIQKEADKRYCIVHYVFGDKTVSSRITFSYSGRLLFSDWLDVRGRGFKRRATSEYVTSIPFKFINNKIVIKARLNNADTELNMLFDTGADGMALRSDLQEKCSVKITGNHTANVPGGQMQTKISEGNKLILDSLIIPNQNLVLFGNMTTPGIDGIIGGANLFRKYITEVDFENNLIRLYKHGVFSAPSDYEYCNMSYAGGVPTVPFKIYKGEHEFESQFIFDTGAGYEAIMFGSGMKQLEKDSIDKHIPALYHSYNHSIGHKSKIIIGKTDSVKLANMTFEKVNLAMEPYRKENHGRHNVLGSIGLKTLSRFNWIVDLTAYKIYSKSNTKSKLPMAFVLKGYLIEYLGNHLRVIRSLNPKADKEDNLLKSGDYIQQLDDIPALQLTNDKLDIITQKQNVKLVVRRQYEKLELILGTK